jgi:hypothetical protein
MAGPEGEHPRRAPTVAIYAPLRVIIDFIFMTI